MEKRAKRNEEQAQIDKFLEREWVDVISKDHSDSHKKISISPRKMKEREGERTKKEIKRL